MTGVKSLDDGPIVLRQSRLKLAGFFLLTASFAVYGGFSAAKRYAEDSPRWVLLMAFATIVFGVFSLLFACNAAKPGKLVLGPKGFTFHGLITVWSVAWSDVVKFEVIVRTRSGVETRRTVGWTYRAGYEPKKVGKESAPPIPSKANLALPPLWPLAAEDLRDLLEQARARWSVGGRQQASGQEKQDTLIE
jgi:hypothetical protein